MVKLLLSALRWAGVFGLNFGSGGGKTPKNTTQTVISDVAPWAREAAKETLAKGMELTEQGYEQYGGNRLAGFDPMQQQSYTDAQNMGVAPQIGTATQMATQAGQYNPADFQNQYNNQLQQYTGANVNQYMNPYLEGALAPQIREAASAGMQTQNMNAAKAVGMGAFGGTRGALQQSMTEKNTLQNMADINARGYSDAFNQAAGMFSADQQRQMQNAQNRAQYGLSADQAREQSRQFGSTAGLNAAQVLSTLGGQQFQQGMDINKLRNTYGQQQQAQAQKGLDIGYQDWMNQKNFDWDQIMRRSDLLRAVPSGSSSTTSMYSAGPSTAQNVAAAGTAAYGANQLFARGGLAYAGGGVTDEQHVEGDIIPSLSIGDLLKAKTIAEQIGDIGRVQAITEELQSRGVPVEGGTGEQPIPPNSISAMATPDMVDNIMPTQEGMANGGIVAFEDGGQVSGSYSPGNAEIYNKAGQMGLAAMKRKLELQAPKGMTPEQYRAAVMAELNEFDDLAGPDPYAAMGKNIEGRKTDLENQKRKGLGLSLIEASGKLLEGPNLASGLSGALPAFAKSYGASIKDIAEQQDALQKYQFLMEDAKRKERMGDLKGARESVKAAEAAKLAAYSAERTALQGDITGAAALAQPFKPMRPTGGGGGGGAGKEKLPELLQRVKYEDLARINAKLPKDQQRSDQELQREAAEQAMAEAKTSDYGENRLTATALADAKKRVAAKEMFIGPKGMKKFAEANGMTVDEVRKEFVKADMSDDLMQKLLGPYAEKNLDGAKPARGGPMVKEPPAGFKVDKPN